VENLLLEKGQKIRNLNTADLCPACQSLWSFRNAEYFSAAMKCELGLAFS
jgi:hypothetical protein